MICKPLKMSGSGGRGVFVCVFSEICSCSGCLIVCLFFVNEADCTS